MKYTVLLLVLIIFFSCGNNEEAIITENIELNIESLEETVIIKQDTIKSDYPSNYCLDSSWSVYTDVQEGFFMSYTINYKSGKDITLPVDNSIPLIGGVDHPEPHFINDTTYLIPHVAGSSLGYFQLYIYKNGTYKYVEHISENLTEIEIAKIKDERLNPKAKEWLPVINNTYSLNNESIIFKRKATYYPNLNSPDSSSSHTFRFKVAKSEHNFTVEGDSLAAIGFVYSETNPIYYASGHNPYKGFIKGIKQSDNSWLLELNLWLKIKSDIDNKKVDKQLKIKDNFITY